MYALQHDNEPFTTGALTEAEEQLVRLIANIVVEKTFDTYENEARHTIPTHQHRPAESF